MGHHFNKDGKSDCVGGVDGGDCGGCDIVVDGDGGSGVFWWWRNFEVNCGNICFVFHRVF